MFEKFNLKPHKLSLSTAFGKSYIHLMDRETDLHNCLLMIF